MRRTKNPCTAADIARALRRITDELFPNRLPGDNNQPAAATPYLQRRRAHKNTGKQHVNQTDD